jgi:tetratricopeptide (TPR) repeat protein
MVRHCPKLARIFFGWGAIALAGSISGCVEAVPQEVIEAVDHIDRDLVEIRAYEFLPTDYTQFSQQWMALKARAQTDEDLIRWPWEANELEVALRQLQAEGSHIVARLTRERESLRRSDEAKAAQVGNRFEIVDLQVNDVDSRSLSWQKPNEIERLMKQARVLYEQGEYDQSLNAYDRAAQSLFTRPVVLRHDLR